MSIENVMLPIKAVVCHETLSFPIQTAILPPPQTQVTEALAREHQLTLAAEALALEQQMSQAAIKIQAITC
jgi:hypothetical protein